jgi:heme-degrading monooxygenase HmoA
MQRRNILKLMAVAGVGVSGASRVAAMAQGDSVGSGGESKPIVLYCDLAVDPAREAEMLEAFRTRFKPAAESFRGRGYIDVKMLKLRSVVQGRPTPDPGINYRFQLTYESEEQRQVWIKSDIHQEVWPLIEDTVLNKDYLVLLTDSV